MKKLCPKRILLSLYFSLVHSYLSYGTCVWGNANEIRLNKIRVLQKKVVRIIANVEYNVHSNPLFKELKILKFYDILKMQFACLMFDYDHGNLPICFNTLFNKISSIHSYVTGNATVGKLSKNVAVNTTTHGFTMIKFKGPKVYSSKNHNWSIDQLWFFEE